MKYFITHGNTPLSDLNKIKRKMGFKELYTSASGGSNEDDEEDRPLVSPPSIVYGSCRGEHQFVLEFPAHDVDGEEFESSSPVLLAREPLLFDT